MASGVMVKANESKPQVSVIVAVYNAQEYLNRCMESLLGQTLKKIEIILVDDGSTDQSGAICDEYALNDSRIKVIHKINGGVGSSRRNGLECATGEFVIHVDPDDWVEITMLDEMYSTIKKTGSDYLFCDTIWEQENGPSYRSEKQKSLNHKDIMLALVDGKMFSSLCNCLISMSAIKRYSLQFIDGLDYREDTFFLLSLLQHPVKVDYLPKAYYHYDRMTNDNSISRKKSEIHLNCIKKIVSLLQNDLNTNGYDRVLYRLKAMAKEKAVSEGALRKKELRKLYPEINKQYITEYLCCKGYKMQKLTIMGIVGFPRVAHSIYRRFR